MRNRRPPSLQTLHMLSIFRKFTSPGGISYDQDEINRIVGNKCYYKVLNVKEECSDKEVKVSYLGLTKKYHPDICKLENSMEVYKKITESYAVLSNAQLRTEYTNRLGQMRSAAASASGFDPKNHNFDQGGSFWEEKQRRATRNYNYWTAEPDPFNEEYRNWREKKNEQNTKDQESKRKDREKEGVRNQIFTVMAIASGLCLYVGGFFEKGRGEFSQENNSSQERDRSMRSGGIVVNSLTADGVLSDSPIVMQARFKSLKKEFEQKNIVIEVQPNKLHPKYQKLSKEPEHIKAANRILAKNGKGMMIVKSDSIYQDATFKKRLSLEEHRDMFNDMILARDTTDLEVALNKIKSSKESSTVEPNENYNHKTGKFTEGMYM